VPGTGVGAILTRDHSVVLARVSVSFVSINCRLNISLVLSEDIWDVAMVVVVPVGAK
jgi:hypothetical protein